MDFLEFLFSLFEALELIEPLCKLVAWLFRSLFRFIRWMMGSSEVSRGWVYLDQTKGRFASEASGMRHLSLTRRRRGKWQGASYVLR